MTDLQPDDVRTFVFKHRGTLLAIPAVLLAVLGTPSAFGIALGLPIAIAGELVRCWAVGYSGVTTRGDVVTAPKLVTSGPYAYVRNPLYVGNFITAFGFAIAFTGKNLLLAKILLIGGSLGVMTAVYAIIIPHEERYLRAQFGEAFDRYRDRVPPIVPRTDAARAGEGVWDPRVIKDAETRTFLTFGVMLVVLAFKALRG